MKMNRLRATTLGWVLHLLLALTVCMTLSTGCRQTSSSPPPLPAAPASGFVGNAACVPCHPQEHNQHRHSRHAQTLRLVSPQSLGKQAPPAGQIAGTDWSVSVKAGQFAVATSRQSSELLPLQYVLGSGKTGMTFVSATADAKLTEVRLSYFPRQKKWYTTPGQERLAANVVGSVHSAADGQRCLLCHAVSVSPEPLKVETPFLGVGCESCHGPGKAHIAAMQTGRGSDGGMEKLSQWPAARLNSLCGKCHGSVDESAKRDVQAALMMRQATNRLQVYGLMESPCYKQSHDTLSCITCHNPHTDAATSPKPYEAVCLSCHATRTTSSSPSPSLGKPCPVNPKTQCIRCHMPDRPAIPHSSLPIFMADHLIRVYK